MNVLFELVDGKISEGNGVDSITTWNLLKLVPPSASSPSTPRLINRRYWLNKQIGFFLNM